MKPVYMDYNATTPTDPQVLEAMLPYLKDEFGNPSSNHVYGQRAHEAVVAAREKTAALIGCEPDEIVFTSSGSESNNQAITGTATAHGRKGHIVTSQTEHPAVLKTCNYLRERLGYRVTYLPVDKFGIISTEDLEKAITDETVLVTIMHANNETGTIQPIEEISKILNERGILFHTDAAQSCGKTDVDVDSLEVDLLTIAGHKLYAPKGIGALYIRNGTQLDSLIHGGGQERGRRAGTENVPYIVGLGKACEIAKRDLPDFKPRIKDSQRRALPRHLGQAGWGFRGIEWTPRGEAPEYPESKLQRPSRRRASEEHSRDCGVHRFSLPLRLHGAIPSTNSNGIIQRDCVGRCQIQPGKMD